MSKEHTAKFTFAYLLSLVSLVFLALSTGIIIFQIINKTIGGDHYSLSALRFAISALFVATPIYYLTTKQINKYLLTKELSLTAGIRKWLIYLILFVVAIVVIGWSIATINTFLSGEITLAFILKFLTILIITGSIFGYYFYDTKRTEAKKGDKTIKIYFYLSLILVIAIFITSFFFIDSPQTANKVKNDNLICRDLDRIDAAISQYYMINKKLPESLEELTTQRQYALNENILENKKTKQKYVYRLIDAKNYEICAVFQTTSKQRNKDLDANYYYNDNCNHEVGRQCFRKTMVDSLLKPF